MSKMNQCNGSENEIMLSGACLRRTNAMDLKINYPERACLRRTNAMDLKIKNLEWACLRRTNAMDLKIKLS